MKIKGLGKAKTACSEMIGILDDFQCEINDKESEILDNSYAGMLSRHKADGLVLLQEAFQDISTFWKQVEKFERTLNELENFKL